ncbi:MAG TPA: hypothetical protein VNI52_06875 [Sphingobacteriaceae bacterium]|nr:hypothetical protein [Sphingobacteriaceae bacterium]
MTRFLIYKVLLFSILFLVNLPFSFSQIFDSEQNPPALKWHQINTQNFQIIYPIELETEAQRMANTLEVLVTKVNKSLQKQPRKISIILQNQGTTSNGFVQLAPRRSEFYTTPPQEFDSQDWLNSLAIHELRHVVQFEKLTGYLKKPLFEELGLAIFGITLPPWFYEGDAVGIETALTKAGRGRLPSWEIIFRTNTLSGKKYSYSKDFMGSVRDQTPGYYQLGYFMTTKLRRDYGKDILDSIYTRLKRNPVRPYNLSNSIKYFTGVNTRELHNATVKELDSLWRNQQQQLNPIEYKRLNQRVNETPTDYYLPAAISSEEILVIKKGKATPPAFTLIDASGKEKKILRIGYQEEANFSYSKNKIAWDELRIDARFRKRSFNVVNIHDLKTSKTRQLTHKSRLFAPALSPDAELIAAVDISVSNKISIVELDSRTGSIIKRYSNDANYMLQTPYFNHAGDKLIVVAVSTEGKTLIEIDRKSGVTTQLLPFESQQISRPVYAGRDIIFKAHYNGLDNIYKLERATNKIYQVTSAPFGAFNPWYDTENNRILMNNHQLQGLDISSAPLNQLNKVVSTSENTFIDYYKPLQAQEGETNVFADIPNQVFSSKPYKESNNLFYFHSASLIAEDNEYLNDYNLGITLNSNNQLNTMDVYGGYRFNNALKRSEYLAGLTYKRFFPILNLTYLNQAREIFQRNKTPTGITLVPITWRENVTEANVSVPVSLNRLNHNYSMRFSIGTSYTSRYDVSNRPKTFVSEIILPSKYSLSFGQSTIRSARDLAPRWGQSFNFGYKHFPFDNKFSGELFTFKSRFYFPGMVTNHTLQAAFNAQHSSGTYNMNIDIPRVRGHSHLKPTARLKNTFFIDYRFPMFYPDWEIGPLAYIKRVRGGLFSDFENIGLGNNATPRTYGLDMQMDMNILRFYLPNFGAGGRIIFAKEKSIKKPIFEFTSSFNF